MTQYSYEQSAGFAKSVGFGTGGSPSPAATIIAIAAAENGLKVGPEWYAAAYVQSLHGHDFSSWASFRSGKYRDFTDLAQQVVSTGSGASDPNPSPGIGDIIGSGGDVIGGAASGVGDVVGALGGVASGLGGIGSALAPLKSLADLVGFVGKAAGWIADRHNWVRILQVVLGAAGIYVGIVIIRTDVQELEQGAALAALAA